MRSRAIKVIGCCTVALLLTAGSSALAQQGDCNDDGIVGIGDVMSLGNYLTGGAPPLAPDKCDCDGFPGVNFGDMSQIQAWLIFGPSHVSFYDSPGTDLLKPSEAEFFIVGEPNGVTSFEVEIVVDIPIDIAGLQMAFSFAPEPGQSVLNCVGVDFTGSVSTGLSSSFDNTNKLFCIFGDASGASAIPAGSRGLLCTVTFELAGASGDPVEINPSTTDRYYPILFSQFYYTGTDLERVYNPRFHHWPIADVDCDGLPNITDAVYIIAWIFSFGPAPFDPDDDGIPDCYSTL